MRRDCQALLQFAEEPLLHRTVVVAVSGERGNEAYGGKAVPGHEFFVGVIPEDICVRGITVKIQDHRGLLDSLGFHYIKVEWITRSPLYLQQFHGVARLIVDKSGERSSRH